MPSVPSSDKVRFTLRMPPELYEQIKESADRNKRSVAREIEFIVEEALSQKKRPTDTE